MMRYGRVKVRGLEVFYREAGQRDASALLLLHGFPSSSHMFRELMPKLADRFRLIAPDLPGFGFSEAVIDPKLHTFDELAAIVREFCVALELSRFALYVFDYGAPVGFRLAMQQAERIVGIISQNGNAYREGLSDGWNPIRKYWEQPSLENRVALRMLLTPETTRWQYLHGVSDAALVAPESYTLDAALLARPENEQVQLDLFLDYARNVELYPEFQAYFRAKQPPFLAVWGKNDPFFLPAGAEAFRRDLPRANVKFYDTGHFALETHATQVAEDIRAFLEPLCAR